MIVSIRRNSRTMKSMRNIVILLFSLVLPAYSAIALENNTGTDDTNNSDNSGNSGNSINSEDSDPSIADKYIQQYLDQIAEQEKLHGGMDAELGEQLLGLGLLYKNHEQYDKAAEVLERSLQIKRVNDGIQNMDQIPILKALIEVNGTAKNWDELDRNYHLLLWVYQRNLDPGDPELLPIIDIVGHWKLVAFKKGLLSESPETTLYDLIEMYQSTVNLMTKLYGENDPRLIGPLNGLSISRYQLATQIANTPVNEFQGFERKTRLITQCTRILDPTGIIRTICRPVEVPNTGYYISKQNTKDQRVNDQLFSIRNNLSHIVKICSANQTLPVHERAEALVNLGDWYFINNKKNTALDNYNQAYKILSTEHDTTELIDKYFGSPVRIPFGNNTTPDTKDEMNQATGEPYVKLSFAVTADGKARNIKVIEESEPKSFKYRKRARSSIDTALFRPRLENGKPVATKEVKLVISGDILQEPLSQSVNPHDSVRTGTIITY